MYLSLFNCFLRKSALKERDYYLQQIAKISQIVFLKIYYSIIYSARISVTRERERDYYFPQIAQIAQIFLFRYFFYNLLCENQRYQRDLILPADCADIADFFI
jgi:hypothetical protein